MKPPATGSDAAPAVETAGLGRRYGAEAALRDVTFAVAPGEIFAVLGPNGGGKSTLFRILATLLPPTEGEASVLGHGVASEPDRVRALIGVVFQMPALDPKLTVRENLLHHGHLHGLWGRGLRRRAEEAIALFGLAGRERDEVRTLSGGLARRVELAKALLHRPRLLLLDEPSTGLDPAARLDFMDLLRGLRDRDAVTVLLTTHFLEEADRADRVAILDRGRLVALGTPDALRSQVGGDVVTLRAADPAALRAKIADRFGVRASIVNGSVRAETPRGHELLGRAVEAFPDEILHASFGRPTLEDLFVRLTGRRLGDGAAEGAEGPAR
jgi:ABC-2 type transport system ATP-binding protein